MQAIRIAKIEALVKQELTVKIRDLKDPRISAININNVKMTSDGSQLTVFFTLFGESLSHDKDYSKEIKDTLGGLASSTPFLKKHLAKCLSIRHVPNLLFKYDRGLQNAIRVEELLKQLEKEKKSTSDHAN